MRDFLLILHYRWLSLVRYVRHHGFVYFALGPLFVGVAAWIAERYLWQHRDVLAEALASPGKNPGTVGYVLVLVLTMAGLASVRRELFPVGRADMWLELLPVAERPRLAAALMICVARLVPGTLLIVALAALALPSTDPAGTVIASWTLRGLLALPAIAGVQLLAVLLATHFGPWRGGRLLVGVGAVGTLFATAFLASEGAWGALLLAPWRVSANQFEILAAQAVEARPYQAVSFVDLGTGLVTWLILGAIVLALGSTWRRRDLEKVQTNRGRRVLEKRAGQRFVGSLARLERPVAAQVLRDGLLVVRRFSPVVDLALIGVILSYAWVLLALPLIGLVPLWHVRLAQIGCLLATLSLTALVPWVLEHELPRFWIERSTGIDLLKIWKAKPCLAFLLGLPTFGLGAGILALTLPSSEAEAVGISVLSFVMAAVMIAWMTGVAAFEVPERPLVNWLFSAMVGTAFAALTIFVPGAWWLWAVGFVVVASLLQDRAARRIQWTEVGR